jgi:glycosyltransferase involved in cell wall biosynthesis
METPDSLKIGYVVKRYPRYSETFIVSEILAHEAANADVRIFALRPSFDTHFQNVLSRVRAPVTYLGFDNVRTVDFWQHVTAAAAEFPALPHLLLPGAGETPVEVCQGIALARAARAAGVDHLHAHFATSATTVARIASRLTGIPFTFTAHAKDIYLDSVDHRSFERKLADAAACVTVSDFNLEFLQQQYAMAAGKTVTIYNGVDVNDFPYRSPADRKPVIVGVGRLIEKKGFAELIEACALLRAQGTDFTCRLVGTGPLEESLRQGIQDYGLNDYVTLIGPRPQADVINEVQSAAVLAAPCVVGLDGDRDGLPTVILEAMALGTPCVGTPVTGIPEALLDGQTGLLVPERDPGALALALSRMLGDPSLRVRLARAARECIETRFNSRRNAASLRELFANVQRTHQPGRI